MDATVITSSIGRKELRQCIESVQAQTHPCEHYVFVNGPRWHESAQEILKDYPGVHAFYLPEETGETGGGPSMADVFAGAPYLTRSEWIFFLNDDDFYDPNHVETLLSHIKSNNLKWAYSLRKFVNIDGEFICHDDWNSLGYWPCLGDLSSFLVDNSCYVVHRSLATRYGAAWTALPWISDRCFLMALKESKAPYGSTGLSTVNYRVGTGTAPADPRLYLQNVDLVKRCFPEGFPWRRPTVFNDDHPQQNQISQPRAL